MEMVVVELIGYAAGSLPGISVLATVVILARIVGAKKLLAQWSQYLEVRLTARKMRAIGASRKEISRFLARSSIDRTSRSP